jgi:transcriptional regulator with XRE-family HTH domain
MDGIRIGRRLRALRHHHGWRQEDVGRRSGTSQDAVSRAERGRIEVMPVARLRALAAALDADLVITLRWRGGDLDRLLDEGHAAVCGAVASLLSPLGWEVHPEVTFSVYGERGSIDLLAWHAPTRTLLVIEVKTELTSVEETLRRHDTKVRLARGIAVERYGWRPLQVGRLLVLPDTRTNRRRVGRHDGLLLPVYPLRSGALRAWLRQPSRANAGLAFVSMTHLARRGRGPLARKRIGRGGTRTSPRPMSQPALLSVSSTHQVRS